MLLSSNRKLKYRMLFYKVSRIRYWLEPFILSLQILKNRTQTPNHIQTLPGPTIYSYRLQYSETKHSFKLKHSYCMGKAEKHLQLH